MRLYFQDKHIYLTDNLGKQSKWHRIYCDPNFKTSLKNYSSGVNINFG